MGPSDWDQLPPWIQTHLARSGECWIARRWRPAVSQANHVYHPETKAKLTLLRAVYEALGGELERNGMRRRSCDDPRCMRLSHCTRPGVRGTRASRDLGVVSVGYDDRAERLSILARLRGRGYRDIGRTTGAMLVLTYRVQTRKHRVEWKEPALPYLEKYRGQT